jgi:hypothetical protein
LIFQSDNFTQLDKLEKLQFIGEGRFVCDAYCKAILEQQYVVPLDLVVQLLMSKGADMLKLYVLKRLEKAKGRSFLERLPKYNMNDIPWIRTMNLEELTESSDPFLKFGERYLELKQLLINTMQYQDDSWEKLVTYCNKSSELPFYLLACLASEVNYSSSCNN